MSQPAEGPPPLDTPHPPDTPRTGPDTAVQASVPGRSRPHGADEAVDAAQSASVSAARPGPVGARGVSLAPVRASDAEREDTVQRLHQALGEGRLDLAETDTRTASADAAVYRSQLITLVDDLPPRGREGEAALGATEAPSWQMIWTALVWRARDSLWDEAAGHNHSAPPGPGQRRVAALVFVLAGLWLLMCTVIGAML